MMEYSVDFWILLRGSEFSRRVRVLGGENGWTTHSGGGGG